MKIETKIQMEQRLKNEARQRIKDRINKKKWKYKSNTLKIKTKQDITIPLIITIHLMHKNMINFNTMYFNTIIPTLIQNTSTILK